MIFGIPWQIAFRPYFVSVFDMKTRLLHYHPKNPEGSLDYNVCLTST